jgi:hypothetical protein
MSVTMTSVRVITPPPPIPWIVLPTRITVKFFAIAATTAPTPKKARLRKRIGFLPKIWLNEPRTGWNTVLARRNEVPDQKA